MDIDLTNVEKELLVAILEKELEDIRSEQRHTKAFDYKESLRCREEIVRELLAKLAA